MRYFRVLVWETLLQLTRDLVFIPGLLFGVFLLVSGYFLRQMTLEGELKVLADIYAFALHMGIGAFALFWGVDLIAGPDKKHAMTFRLAGPLSRHHFLLGRYLGLCLCLVFFGIPTWFSWQFASGGETLSLWQEAQFFLSHCLGWFVLAALGMALGTMMSFYVALFGGFALWLCGLVAEPIVSNVAADLSFTQRIVLTQISLRWDLSRFALPYPQAADVSLLSYGSALVAILLTFGCLRFRTLDL